MDDQIKTIKEISVGIYDMALTKSTDILLSMAVQMLNCWQSGEIKQFPSVAPLLPTGIHVTSDNNIILGAMEKVF